MLRALIRSRYDALFWTGFVLAYASAIPAKILGTVAGFLIMIVSWNLASFTGSWPSSR